MYVTKHVKNNDPSKQFNLILKAYKIKKGKYK